MDVKVIIDYKVVLALGVIAVGTIFALRMEPDAIKEVSIYAVGAARGARRHPPHRRGGSQRPPASGAAGRPTPETS